MAIRKMVRDIVPVAAHLFSLCGARTLQKPRCGAQPFVLLAEYICRPSCWSFFGNGPNLRWRNHDVFNRGRLARSKAHALNERTRVPRHTGDSGLRPIIVL